ncbi:phosphate/phosphite/phosphonate ABC transporter substrate-binding protein [Alsobacter sp. R-9]
MSTRPTLFANARMYAVTPAVEEAWRTLLAHVAEEAGVTLDYLPYPAPQPLETLWRRADLGCAFMCGYPIALRLADVTPIAAPVPSLTWAQHRPVYRSDLIVRDDSPFRTLEDTFGHRAGWTVEHSHSGFNAFRHHLLAYRTSERPVLYAEMVGSLVTARAILDAVREGRIDVGPLDAYWHALIRRHNPALTDGVRIIASTDVAPMPAFVAGPATAPDAIARLRAAFSVARDRAWFAPLADTLLVEGFVPVSRDDFAPTLAWDREAVAAGYTVPR